MAMKINGVDGTFNVPRVVKDYLFVKFDRSMTAGMAIGPDKTVDVKIALEAAWKGVVQRSNQKPCNEYFKTLFRQKTLTEIINEGDIVLHRLEPKAGFGYSILPNANTAGRDIGIDPSLFFDPSAAALVCTLIHELAHVGGASTDAGAALPQAHAAEKALMSCACQQQYRSNILGSIKGLTSGPDSGRRFV